MQTNRTLVPQDALEGATIFARSSQPKIADSKQLIVGSPAKPRNVFAEALLEKSTMAKPRRARSVFAAVSFQVAALICLVMIPLLFTEAIDLHQFNTTMLIAPLPPSAPPPPPLAGGIVRPVAPKKVFTSEAKLLAPTVIPRQIASVKDAGLGAPTLEASAGGVSGGVPGGVPGGVLGGVPGGVIGGIGAVAPPPPPVAAAPTKPVRIGGNVRPPRIVSRIEPAYPLLAAQARIHGDVVIDAVIDPQGNVAQMHAISGSPLLVRAAMDALRQWKYEPTLLNGQPVSVELEVILSFEQS
jgi:protein TonB